MKKRIVFHFYYNRSLIDNVMYKVHKTCLSRYSHLFDTAIFNIVLDDVDDTESLEKAKQFIFDTGFKKENTVFYISENTEMRDSQTFYDYVVKDLGSYDGITFFGHSKGLTNICNDSKKNENIVVWVFAMYFFNIETLKIFEDNNYISYLNPCVDNSKFISEYNLLNEPKYGYYPIGTFFWINDQKLKKYIEGHGVNLPPFIDRFYAEKFIGNVLPLDWSLVITYGKNYGLNMLDFYLYGKNYIEMLYKDTHEWCKFEKIYKKFLEDEK